MKLVPTLFLSLGFFMMMLLTSCTRDYTCQCTISFSGSPGLPSDSVSNYKIRDTKKKAKSACESHSGTYVNGSVTTTETCYLY